MGYQVTARKWRPQNFDDIVEQRHVTQTLKNAIRLGRVAHAYLFAGTRGVGKTTTARVLAKALNCACGPTVEPCNTCRSCLEITQGTSLDVVEIDAASNRGIDEIRDLRERLRYLPTRSRYKVYIIDEVHMLTKEAFNALLKTLEEPPSHVVFVFATTELEKIPHTILSRCQRFGFKRISLAGIVAQLERIAQGEGITISHTSLRRVAQAAEGSMRDAQSLLDQVVAFCGLTVQDGEVEQLLGMVGSEKIAQCLTALFRQDVATALRTVHALQAEGCEPAEIISALIEGLRHVMVLKTVRHPKDFLSLSEADIAALRPVADIATVEEIYGQFHRLSVAENSLRYASNPFIVLEMTLVGMACIGRVQSLQAILDRLQGLEANLPATSGPSTSAPGGEGRRGDLPVRAVRIPSAPHQEGPARVRSPADESFWGSLLKCVESRRPALAAFLQAGRVLARTEEEVVIGFSKQERFNCISLGEPENLRVVREAVQAVSGRLLHVKFEVLEDETDGANEITSEVVGGQEACAGKEQQEKKRQAIQAILDIFDGHIIP